MSQVKQLVADISKISTGYGMMSLTWKAKPVPLEQAFEAMRRVVELARSKSHKAFFNIGEFYGENYINLHYVRDFFKKYPELRKDVIVSCKGAMNPDLTPAGSREFVKNSVESCVREMGGYIDIFEVARLDLNLCKNGDAYPRETFEVLAELVDQGTIGGISLSEVTEEQIRGIHKDFAKYLTCVEVELSMFSTNILKDGVAKACSDYNLVIICYSPLGRGMLTGQITATNDLPEGDFRRAMARFNGDALEQNKLLVKFLQQEIVDKRPENNKLSLAQLALGWVRQWNGNSKYPGAKFIPIPSGSTVARVNENFDADKSVISNEEFDKINEFLASWQTVGDRYEFVKNPMEH